MKNIKRELIEQKLNLVVEKLMNLGGPENEAELKDGGEAIGFFKRDFGIAEWDWPQGVGLYGLLKMMKIQGNDDYKTFLHQWFKGNIADGLPSRNINTTTPLLTLAELNEQYQDKEFLYDVAVIVMGNTHINDLGNDDRHQQVKHNFQKLEKRSQNAFFFVVSKIFCECSHFFFFPPFPFYYNKPLLLYSLRDDTYNIVFDAL